MKPAILVIFGITGDLAHRKLLPALYRLADEQVLPDPFKIVGVTRRGTTVEELILAIRASVEATGVTCKKETLSRLEKSITVIKMDITAPAEYIRLKHELDKYEDELGVCLNRLFYLSIPAQVFSQVIRLFGVSGLNKGCKHESEESRLLIEKPFGYDLKSAQELIDEIEKVYTKKQVYRIDHYLAKETVQNILTFRFQNPLFRSVWNNNHISQILITAAESIGIEGRVVFYEQIGALRDIIQSHLLQILSLITMERPNEFTAESIHANKLKLLQSIAPPALSQIADKSVRGQYKGYKEEVSNSSSETETFAAIKLEINNKRWTNVPIYLTTGKSLAQKATEVVITFSDPSLPHINNYLTIRIQPFEGIKLSMQVKKPGYDIAVDQVIMNFSYSDAPDKLHADAYERVLADALRGDKTLFATSEEVMESWRIVSPFLDSWAQGIPAISIYEPGSNGPTVPGLLDI